MNNHRNGPVAIKHKGHYNYLLSTNTVTVLLADK